MQRNRDGGPQMIIASSSASAVPDGRAAAAGGQYVPEDYTLWLIDMQNGDVRPPLPPPGAARLVVAPSDARARACTCLARFGRAIAHSAATSAHSRATFCRSRTTGGCTCSATCWQCCRFARRRSTFCRSRCGAHAGARTGHRGSGGDRGRRCGFGERGVVSLFFFGGGAGARREGLRPGHSWGSSGLARR